MIKSEENKSDHSLANSAARSSSGVSTQKSVDGVAMERDTECQILYGNFFSKYPHPEINDKSVSKPKRNASQSSVNSIEDLDNTFKTSSSLFKTLEKKFPSGDTKSRRHSEAHLRSFNKRKQVNIKRGSISNDYPSESNTVERLLTTINDVQEGRLSIHTNDMDGKISRNPDISLPCGDVQLPITSPTPLGELTWQDLQDTLIFRAENNPRDLFYSMLDGSGRTLSNSCLTYNKLYQKARKISFYITTKLNYGIDQTLNVRPGQSVGLVFTPEDMFDFIIGFFACMLSKVIAVPVEKPSVTQISGSLITKKYLSQLGVTVILTNTSCFKDLARKYSDVKESMPWADMVWVQIDSFYSEKVSKSYNFPNACSTFNAPLYVEYVYSEQNILRGVPVSMESTLSHCHALNFLCGYKEGQSILCTDDLRRQSGLWHGVLTALYCGTSTIYMPYTLVKKNPLIWLLAITKNKISCVVTNSRVLHHCLGIESKELQNVNLSLVENIVVSDASVPWINETLERFIHRFVNNGLTPEAVITSVNKSETLTICMRRRSKMDNEKSPLLKLCLESLSYDLIRETSSESDPTTIYFESSGIILPSMQAIVVRLDDSDQLCLDDEVGEICVLSPFSNRVFWMTPDDVSQYLTVTPNPKDYESIFHEPVTFTRTGLVGFFRNSDSVDHIYVQGSINNFIQVNGRRFNCDDITGTVSVVKPSGILHKARCCVFTVPILNHNRLVIAVEVNTFKYSDSKIYDWISNVMQAVLNLHQLNVYCIVGIPPNTFPKTLLGDINITETKSRFMIGHMSISHLILCPQTAIHNLPMIHRSSTINQPFSPASLLAHAFNSNNFASISGVPVDKSQRIMSLGEILEWRASHTPTQSLISIVSPKFSVQESLNWQQLHKRAERVFSLLKDKLKCCIVGSVVAVILANPLEIMYAIYGCYYAGMVPLVLSTLSKESSWIPFGLMEHIWACKHSKAVACLTSSANIRYLKSKECNAFVPGDMWPLLIDITETPKKKSISIHTVTNPDKELALIRLYIDQTGMITLPAWTHANISTLSNAYKIQNELTPGTEVALCMDMSTVTGVFLNCITSVYCGYHSFVIAASVMDTNPDCWLEFVSRKSIKHTFGSELSLSQTVFAAKYSEACSFFKKPGLNLSHVESFVICVSERPNHTLIKEFLLIVEDNKFELETLSIGIDCPWCPGYFVQIEKGKAPYTVYLDKTGLRSYRISEIPMASASCIEVVECGMPLPGSTVLIVDYKQQCQKSINQLGELWLASDFNCRHILATATSKQLEDLYRDVLEVTRTVCDSDTCDVLADNILAAKLAMGDNERNVLVKTGLLGYLRSTPGNDNQLVVLGKADDVINLRGFSYFSSEIETIINLVDTSFINRSVVFLESDLLIAVIETSDNCSVEICLSLLPKIVKAVLENNFLPLAIIQFVKFGQIALSWGSDRRRVKSLWIRRLMDSYMQFYCL